MKPLAVIAALLLASQAYAELPSLSFPTPTLELPPLSLSDIHHANVPDIPTMAESWLQSIAARRGAVELEPRSKMPILKPKANIDPKMIIKPDESVDYKMIVMSPDRAAAATGRQHK